MIVDSGDHASILDGCLLSRAKLRAFRHNRLDKLEKMLAARPGRRRRRAGRRRRRLLDGGRHRAAARDLRALRALRRAPDGRRGPRRRGARRARRRDRRAARRRGSRRPAHGHLLQVARLLRRLRRGLGRRDRVPALLLARLPLHRLGRARRARRRARGPARAALAPTGRRCSSACSTTPGACATGCEELGFAVVAPQALPADGGVAGRRAGRRAPAPAARATDRHADRLRCSSATTGRRRCCGARCTTRACSSTPRCTPPCPRAARCCAPA